MQNRVASTISQSRREATCKTRRTLRRLQADVVNAPCKGSKHFAKVITSAKINIKQAARRKQNNDRHSPTCRRFSAAALMPLLLIQTINANRGLRPLSQQACFSGQVPQHIDNAVVGTSPMLACVGRSLPGTPLMLCSCGLGRFLRLDRATAFALHDFFVVFLFLPLFSAVRWDLAMCDDMVHILWESWRSEEARALPVRRSGR